MKTMLKILMSQWWAYLITSPALGMDHQTMLHNGCAKMLGRPIAAHEMVTEVLAGGMSGDAVYKIKLADGTYVAKVGLAAESLQRWQQGITIQALAGAKGLAPRVFYSEPDKRLVISEFVAGEPLIGRYFNQATRHETLQALVAKLKAVHSLNVSESMLAPDAKVYTDKFAAMALAHAETPKFVGEVYQRFGTIERPTTKLKSVLAHNDLNPNNVLFDGRNVQFIDWDGSGVSHPYYDLATIANFYLMSDTEAKNLLGLYLGSPAGSPEMTEFKYFRALSFVFSGLAILATVKPQSLARYSNDNLATVPRLAMAYQLMGQGNAELSQDTGRVVLGLAMIKEASLYLQ